MLIKHIFKTSLATGRCVGMSEGPVRATTGAPRLGRSGVTRGVGGGCVADRCNVEHWSVLGRTVMR